MESVWVLQCRKSRKKGHGQSMFYTTKIWSDMPDMEDLLEKEINDATPKEYKNALNLIRGKTVKNSEGDEIRLFEIELDNNIPLE